MINVVTTQLAQQYDHKVRCIFFFFFLQQYLIITLVVGHYILEDE